MTRPTTRAVRPVLAVVAALVCAGGLLWLADRVLDPVPLPAATAVAGGLAAVLVLRARGWVMPAGAALGLLAGVLVHLAVHWTASSPVPAEGVSWHLLRDAARSLATAAPILGCCLLLERHLRRSPSSRGSGSRGRQTSRWQR